MIINLLRKNHMTSLELPSIVLGQFWLTDVTEDNEEKEIIAIEGIDNKWELKANKKCRFEDKSIHSVILQENQIYQMFDENEEKLFIYVELEFKNTFFRKYKLTTNEISIGRNQDNTICINNMMVSSNHCKIKYDNGSWIVKDLNSTNGTYVNQLKCDNTVLNLGDLIYILGTKIILGKNFISISINENVKINENIMQPIKFPSIDFIENEEEIEQSYFYQSPRMKRDIQERLFKVDSPPDDQVGEEMPLMMVIGPSLTMGIASLSTGIFAVSNAISTGNIASATPSIIMSFSMLLGTVMWPIITKKYEKKRKHEKEALRQKKYGEYLDKLEKEIFEESEIQKEILCENSPSAEKCIESIRNIERRLWERTSKQNDFLNLRLGMGKKKLECKFSYSERKFTLIEDDLKERLYRICEKEKYIRDVPITISIFDNYITGIIGKKETTDTLVKNLITQIVTFYSYEEVKLIFLYDQNDAQFDFVKWLPHVFDNSLRNRFIAKNKAEMKELLIYFENVITFRQKLNENDLDEEQPYYIIFSLKKELGAKFDVIKSIEKAKDNLRFSVINVCEEIKDLPKACKSVVEVSSLNGNIYDLSDLTGRKTVFKPDLYEIDCNEISKRLANVPLDILESGKLPKVLPFLQMYNVGKIEYLNPLLRWKENDPTSSLEAPIGVDIQGDLFKLDLHEKYHGPHGLVAGMTGSGKSEFIITYILSLAVNYHPEEVSFILIDYKGGGMAKAFEKLPHIAGIITNLDGTEVKRSLISIESELKRRQSIFDSIRETKGVSNLDIYKYQKLYREGKVQEPLSHLFIISDEFAELKTQQPEFMSQLVSAARIGRSLGVHLILATQKPSGVVDDQIWSNSRFRVCLKVQERSDSMDMLKRPDAAELADTGRFYLQVGYNEMFELGQSAWSGATYYPSERTLKEKDNIVSIIDTSGHEIVKGSINYQKIKHGEGKKQLDEITSFLANLAEKENIHIRPIWLEPIAKTIYYEDIIQNYNYMRKKDELEVIIGIYDDPVHQRQGLFNLSITNLGNIAIFESSGNGRNMILNIILYSLCHNYTPDEVNVYALDFSGGVLKCFSAAPQVGDIIMQDEDEKISNLFKMLLKEIKERRVLFANYSGDIRVYNANNIEKVQEIVVIIDNITAFNEIYEENEDMLIYLSREGKQYGIYFIVTASSINGIRYRMQQNFSQYLALRLNDESDYLTIVGKTEGLIPADFEGRGLVKMDGDIFEFQTAIAVGKNNSYFDIESYCEKLNKKYTNKARKVPILPKEVTLELMKPYYDGDLNLPIGINYINLNVVKYDFSKNYINCILSTYQDNENILVKFIDVIDEKYEKYVLDISCSSYNEKVNGYYSITNCEKAIDEIFEIVLNRNNTYKESDKPEKVIEGFKPIIIAINSVSELYNHLSDSYIEKLDLILEKGMVEYRINILLSDNMGLSQFMYKSWFKSRVNTNEYIWLGEGMPEQYSFQPIRKVPIVNDFIEKGSGFIVKANEVYKIRFLYDREADNYG